MRLRLSVAYGLVLGLVLAGPAFAVEPDAPDRLITRTDAVRVLVQDRLAKPFWNETAYEKAEHGALVEFYADNSNGTVWVDENGLKPKARLVIKELRRAADYGLNPADYDLPEETILSSNESTPTARLAEFEFALSHAALAYARHARGGRFAPGTISYNLDPTLNLPEPLEVMERMAALEDPASYLREFHPKHPQFEALRKILVRTRGGTGTEKRVVIQNGPTLKPGNSHKHIARLRNRPMNRVKTILVNMERWRWIPEHNGKLNIQVNVPEFRFRVFDGYKTIHSERVVVGKVKHQTPIFSDKMEYLVFHPYWNVPNSIKKQEILPYLMKGSGGGGRFNATTRPRILQTHNLFVQYRGRDINASAIDWRTADVRRYRFYQPPGGKNVLGFVKFIFPNKHIVYMHDTPTKSLFNKTVRAYSHGCIRVRNPRKLAEIILGRDRGWSPGNVDSAISSGKNRRVNLKNPVPVNITYFTARVEKNGKITYFGDLYGHDARMAAALKL